MACFALELSSKGPQKICRVRVHAGTSHTLTRSRTSPFTAGYSRTLLKAFEINMLRTATRHQSVLGVEPWSAGSPSGLPSEEIRTIREDIAGTKLRHHVHHGSRKSLEQLSPISGEKSASVAGKLFRS